MKYGDFILKVRSRLTDMRTPANVWITTADTDGRRWTADKLGDICKDAIQEAVRLIATYSVSPVVKQMGSQNILTRLEYTTASSGEVALPNDLSAVVSVTEKNGKSFGYIDAKTLELYRNDSKLPRKDERFYSVFYDLITNKMTLALLPATKVTVRVFAIYSDSNFSMLDLSKHVPLRGLNDFLVDIAEREAREQEGNLARAQVLDRRILMKLGLSTGGQ